MLWFYKTQEEFDEAAKKALAILEQAGMSKEGIEHFLRNDELVWSTCDDPETVLNWNKTSRQPLSSVAGWSTLVNMFID